MKGRRSQRSTNDVDTSVVRLIHLIHIPPPMLVIRRMKSGTKRGGDATDLTIVVIAGVGRGREDVKNLREGNDNMGVPQTAAITENTIQYSVSGCVLR